MTCEANVGGENSSFIFKVCVKSVPFYRFKLAYVVLHMAVKEFSKPTSKNEEIGRFNRSLITESFQLTLEFHPGAFAWTENNLMLVRRLENYALISDSYFIKPTPFLWLCLKILPFLGFVWQLLKKYLVVWLWL